MFLRKVDGPGFLRDASGNIITRADLPPPDTVRWVASRKALVVAAVEGGLISDKEACQRYGLSEEELQSWCTTLNRHGIKALRVTRLQKYRGER